MQREFFSRKLSNVHVLIFRQKKLEMEFLWIKDNDFEKYSQKFVPAEKVTQRNSVCSTDHINLVC